MSLIALVATLSLANAQVSPSEVPGTDDAPQAPHLESERPRIGFAPHAVPFGAQFRYHAPAGRFGSVMLGAGAALAVFDTGGTTPVRLRGEVGYDYYLGERYNSFFFGGRAIGSYWTAPPIIGGSNVGAGPVFGRRMAVGKRGATISVAGTVQVRYYDSIALFESSATLNDGIQLWPGFDLEFTLPTRRR